MEKVVSSSLQAGTISGNECADTGTGYTVSDIDKSQAIHLQEQPELSGEGKYLITIAFLEAGGCFDLPIQVASTQLGVGVMTLKRVCRANTINRWPFRKRKSLGNLIEHTRQVLDDVIGQDNMQKLAAIQLLEKQRQVVKAFRAKTSVNRINHDRQAVFKLNHIECKKGEDFAYVFDGKFSCFELEIGRSSCEPCQRCSTSY